MRIYQILFPVLRPRNIFITAFAVTIYINHLLDKPQSSDFKPLNLSLNLNEMENCSIFIPSSLKAKDWHNYTLIKLENEQEGIGEKGAPVVEEPGLIGHMVFSMNGYNADLGDKIALNRSLPDVRHPGCKKKMYIESLPTVSVIIPFHGEHLSTLLRTVTSVLNRSPKHLIKEIILVNDDNKEFSKQYIEMYLNEFMPKVKVIHLEQRSGLVAARMTGVMKAKADVLVFLDSHTEVNVNWLPPLLEPIALNYRVVSCPIIDVIDFGTFQYCEHTPGRGIFDWMLLYQQLPVLPKTKKNMPEPYDNPVMNGGIFAISRRFFWELGGYDTGLYIWGAEQFELSFKSIRDSYALTPMMYSDHHSELCGSRIKIFDSSYKINRQKIWLCGGRLVNVPCSRVGHILHKFPPYKERSKFFDRNKRRVAEVWMDEYATYIYAREPELLTVDPGNLTKQKIMRQKLKCKPFKWFMTQVAFDLIENFPFEEPKPFAEGHIRPLVNPNLCLYANIESQIKKDLTLQSCKQYDDQQTFILTWHKNIRLKNKNICWDVPDVRNLQVFLFTCHMDGGNQLWTYNKILKMFIHNSDFCLDHDPIRRYAYITSCNLLSKTQRWDIDTINTERMAKIGEQRKEITGPVEKWKE